MRTQYLQKQILTCRTPRATQKNTRVMLSRYRRLRASKRSAPSYTLKLKLCEVKNGATLKGMAKMSY